MPRGSLPSLLGPERLGVRKGDGGRDCFQIVAELSLWAFVLPFPLSCAMFHGGAVFTPACSGPLGLASIFPFQCISMTGCLLPLRVSFVGMFREPHPPQIPSKFARYLHSLPARNLKGGRFFFRVGASESVFLFGDASAVSPASPPASPHTPAKRASMCHPFSHFLRKTATTRWLHPRNSRHRHPRLAGKREQKTGLDSLATPAKHVFCAQRVRRHFAGGVAASGEFEWHLGPERNCCLTAG